MNDSAKAALLTLRANGRHVTISQATLNWFHREGWVTSRSPFTARLTAKGREKAKGCA